MHRFKPAKYISSGRMRLQAQRHSQSAALPCPCCPSPQAAPVKLSAIDPAFVDKARTVGPRQTLLVTNYRLEGDSKPSTLELKRKQVFHKDAKVVVQRSGGAVTKPAPDSRMFTGRLVGSPGSIAVLHVRSNGGVSGIVLRGNGSWALGRHGGAGANLEAPLGSRKSRPEDRTSLPPFTDAHTAQTPTTGGIAAQASPAAAGATVAAATAQPAQLLQVGGACACAVTRPATASCRCSCCRACMPSTHLPACTLPTSAADRV